jgi:hypothetical protein
VTVDELIEELARLPSDLQVYITDGYSGRIYHGPFVVMRQQDETADIGAPGWKWKTTTCEEDE